MASSNIHKIKKRLCTLLDYYRGGVFLYPSNELLYGKLAKTERFDEADAVFIKRVLQRELPKQLRKVIIDELFAEFVTDNMKVFVDELYMNIEQILLMKKSGMEFALHGYEHEWLSELTDIELRKDISNALEVFDGIIDNSEWAFVYPYGSYSDNMISVASSMGAMAGFGTDVALYNPETDDIFKIPRLDTNDFPPQSTNYRKIKNNSEE